MNALPRDSVDARVHAHLYAVAASGALSAHVAPFAAGFDAHSDSVFRNYAVPEPGARPTAGQIAALAAEFAARGRVPRLEYVPAAAPAVEPAPAAAGFAAERRLPVLTCPGPVPDVPVPPGVTVRAARTDADLHRTALVQNDAYGGRPAADEHDVARLRRTLRGGGAVVPALAAPDAGGGPGTVPVGAGLVSAPHGGVGELAAVAVRAAWRRRGIAARVTAELTRAAREAGLREVFLTPEGPDAERVYARIGYRRTAEVLHISRMPVPGAPGGRAAAP